MNIENVSGEPKTPALGNVDENKPNIPVKTEQHVPEENPKVENKNEDDEEAIELQVFDQNSQTDVLASQDFSHEAKTDVQDNSSAS